MDRYSGDPRLVLTPNGATLQYQGGQPVMDQGLENHVLLSLLADERWVGNIFMPTEQRIGSDYERTTHGPITLSKLRDIENSAECALKSKTFGRVEAATTNPTSNHLATEIDLGAGGSVSLRREKALWTAQITDPASRRLS